MFNVLEVRTYFRKWGGIAPLVWYGKFYTQWNFHSYTHIASATLDPSILGWFIMTSLKEHSDPMPIQTEKSTWSTWQPIDVHTT